VLESGRKFATADMLALENDIQSENDLFAAERFVYAGRSRCQALGAGQAGCGSYAQLDGRMIASSTAATIAVRSGQELTRLLLEPRLGAAPGDPKQQENNLELEDLPLGNENGVAAECHAASAQALAAGKYPNYDDC